MRWFIQCHTAKRERRGIRLPCSSSTLIPQHHVTWLSNEKQTLHPAWVPKFGCWRILAWLFSHLLETAPRRNQKGRTQWPFPRECLKNSLHQGKIPWSPTWRKTVLLKGLGACWNVNKANNTIVYQNKTCFWFLFVSCFVFLAMPHSLQDLSLLRVWSLVGELMCSPNHWTTGNS